MCNIFISCITQEEFLNALKIAEVVPTLKKGDHNLINNNRPISLLSQFSKILKKVVTTVSIVTSQNIVFYQLQYGFEQNFSSTHTICNIYEKLIKNADADKYTCCFFLDLTKTFDAVNHTILLEKMNCHFEIRRLLFQLLKNFYLIDGNTQN